jgi:hypothetical protein
MNKYGSANSVTSKTKSTLNRKRYLSQMPSTIFLKLLLRNKWLMAQKKRRNNQKFKQL